MATAGPSRFEFVLPDHLRATAPPEARGLARDQVRMMTAHRSPGRLEHLRFDQLPDLLTSADLLVVNTSATLPAAVTARPEGGGDLVALHFSTRLPGPAGGPERWVVEPRRTSGASTERWAKSPTASVPPPRVVELLPGGAWAELLQPYRGNRLWEASVTAPGGVVRWLGAHGQPIRYSYVPEPWPIDYYQTVFARHPGSAEMPSAGRPFSPATVLELVTRGVGIAPVVLHTGVSSLEPGELPYPERAIVPATTARRANAARQAGGRVVAVGTTVVRALASAYSSRTGLVEEMEGWTNLVVTPGTGAGPVDGLLTGWHGPGASHLLMLEAIAGRPLLEMAYRQSVAEGYLWHEMGDVAIFLP